MARATWPPLRSHDVGHPTRGSHAHRNGARERARTSTPRACTRESRVSSLPRSIARIVVDRARASSSPARARFSGHPRHHVSTTSRAASRDRRTRATRGMRATRARVSRRFRERGARRDRCARGATKAWAPRGERGKRRVGGRARERARERWLALAAVAAVGAPAREAGAVRGVNNPSLLPPANPPLDARYLGVDRASHARWRRSRHRDETSRPRAGVPADAGLR